MQTEPASAVPCSGARNSCGAPRTWPSSVTSPMKPTAAASASAGRMPSAVERSKTRRAAARRISAQDPGTEGIPMPGHRSSARSSSAVTAMAAAATARASLAARLAAVVSDTSTTTARAATVKATAAVADMGGPPATGAVIRAIPAIAPTTSVTAMARAPRAAARPTLLSVPTAPCQFPSDSTIGPVLCRLRTKRNCCNDLQPARRSRGASSAPPRERFSSARRPGARGLLTVDGPDPWNPRSPREPTPLRLPTLR